MPTNSQTQANTRVFVIWSIGMTSKVKFNIFEYFGLILFILICLDCRRSTIL